MNKKELEQLNKLDELCTALLVSYKIEVGMQYGTKITIYFCNDTNLVIGGLDCGLDKATEEAIESLSKIEKKEKN